MPLIAVQDIFLGLGINFIQWIPLRSYNDTQLYRDTGMSNLTRSGIYQKVKGKKWKLFHILF